MSRKISLFLILISLILQWDFSLASHIVGGELSYNCLGNNNYRITLKVYRDCYNGQAPFDDPAAITIFNEGGGVYQILYIDFPGSKKVPNNTYNLCLTAPPSICVEEAVYSGTINLPPSNGGYTLAYQRCCRNYTILNIFSTQSQGTGATFSANIPASTSAFCNSSPGFTKFPPTVVCVNSELIFDHSATDPDGDALVYELFRPFAGGDGINSVPVPASSPPFPLVTYRGAYSFSNPLAGTVPLSIDSKTGLLTGTPNTIGQFVVGVCVREYRNGILLSSHYRDFQFNVVQCLPATTAAILPVGVTTSLTVCKNVALTFPNNSTGGTSYNWDFGDGTTGSGQFPSHIYTASGTYTVTLTVNPGQSCSSTTTAKVVVNPIPPVAPASNSPVCDGDSIKFSTMAVVNATYLWTGPNGFSSDLQKPFIAHSILANTGTYFLVVTENGCSSSKSSSIVVEVNPIPPAPTISSNSPICDGALLKLNSVAVTGALYKWTGPQNFSSGKQNPSINPASVADAGDYLATITISGCTSPPSALAVIINTLPVAPKPTSNAAFCSGNTLNLSATFIAGAKYFWTGPASFSSNVQNPIIPTADTSSAGLYSVVIKVDGCNSPPASTEVIIYPIPVAKASSNSPACVGLPIKLSADTAIGAIYSWTGSKGFSSNLRNPIIPFADFADADDYTVTVSMNGCISPPFTTSVTVNPIPSSPVISNNSPMCSGLTLNLVAENVAGGAFQWTGPSGYNSGVQNPVIKNVPFTYKGNFSSRVTVNGCTSPPAETSVVINLSPPATPKSNSPLCDGQKLDLTTPSIAGATYSWTGPNGFTSDLQNPAINVAGLNDTGIYSVTLTLVNCVGATVPTKVNIYPYPSPPVISSNSSICAGETLQLNAVKVTGGTFSWTGPNGFSSSIQNPLISSATVTSSGDYSATVTVHGCPSSSSVLAALVKPIPPPPELSSNTPLCAGETLVLKAQNPLGGTFSWKGPSGFSSILQNPSVLNTALTNSGKYSAFSAVNGCNSVPAVTDVVIHRIPSSAFVIDSPVCNGYLTEAKYRGASSINAVYNWNFGSGKADSSAGQGPHKVAWSSVGNADVSLTVTENGCVSPTTYHSVLVFPVPTSDFSIPASICESDSAFLTYLGSGSSSASYHWRYGSGVFFNWAVQGPPWLKFDRADTFRVSLEVTENGCFSLPDTHEIVVNIVPTAHFMISPSVICPDQKATVTYTGTGSADATFNWNFGNGTGGENAIGPYAIRYRNPNLEILSLSVTEHNCSSIPVTQVLLVDSLPVVSFTVNDLGCDPFPASFVNESQRSVAFRWKFGDGETSVLQNPVHIYSPGKYTVGLMATSSSGCMDSLVKPDLITVINSPVADFEVSPFVYTALELKDASFTYVNHSKFSNVYSWDFGDGANSQIESPYHSFKDSGSYVTTLIATNDIGCSDTFYSKSILIIPDVNYFIPNAFTPNDDGLNDIFRVYGRSLSSVDLKLYSRVGEKVFESFDKNEGWNGSFNGKKMNPGVYIYFAVIETATGERIIKKGDVTLLK